MGGHKQVGNWHRVAPALIGVLLFSLFPVYAVNDPGHDTLYVVKAGDSNVTGSINVSNEITSGNVRYATLLYGDLLDIRANGSIVSPTSRPAVQATTNSLYLDGNGNLYLNTRAGTTGIIQLGSTTTNAITLNVSGTIKQQNVNVCLENGTNCPDTLTGSNITGSGAANSLSKWSDEDTLTTSIISDNGTSIGIGTSSPTQRLDVNGSMNVSGADAKVYTSELCISDDCRTAWPGGGFAQWRLGSDTGTIASITNDTLVNITGGTMITTSLSGTTLVITNDYGASIDASELALTTGAGSVVLNSTPIITSPTVIGSGSITASSGAFTTLTRAGQNVCTSDGTTCPGTLTGANTTGGGSTGYLARWTSNSNLANSVMYDDGTNIGIGTTNAYSKLQVSGSVNATTYYGAGTGLTGTASSLTSGTSNDLSCTDCIGETEISDVYLLNTGDTASGNYTFDTTTLHVDSTNDRIGIGTTAATSTLHLMGNLSVDGGTAAENANLTGKGLALMAGTGSSTNIDENTGRAGGNVTIRAGSGGDAPTAAGGNGGNLLLSAGNAGSESSNGGNVYLNPGIGEGGNGAIITTGTVNLSNAIHITGSGNIGIGTNTPSASLHIYSTVNPVILYEINASSQVNVIAQSDNNTPIGYAVRDSTGTETSTITWTNINPTTHTADLILATRTAPSALVINDTGNVGIGISAPSQKLTVNAGSILIDNGFALLAKDNASTARTVFGLSNLNAAVFNAGGSGATMVFQIGGSTKATMSNTGDFGIGTTTPNSTLHVIGEANVSGISGDGTGKVVCIKSDGNLGTCSSSVDSSGICTCG